MFGGSKHSKHSKEKTILSGIRKVIQFPKKIQNLDILRKKSCLIAPRFGGKAVYLWTKGKTRVWVDRNTVYMYQGTLPNYTSEGVLACAELFKNNTNEWVVAFEDILFYNGESLLESTSFSKRQEILHSLVKDLRAGADLGKDPGVFSVKPWVQSKDFPDFIKTTEWNKQPEWVIVWAEDHSTGRKGYWFCKIEQISSGDIFVLTKSDDTDPDQYDLSKDDGTFVSRACVRSIRLSKWLASLSNGTRVRCRNVKGFESPEPYETA